MSVNTHEVWEGPSMIEFAEKGNVEKMRFFLENLNPKGNINIRGMWNMTMLHASAGNPLDLPPIAFVSTTKSRSLLSSNPSSSATTKSHSWSNTITSSWSSTNTPSWVIINPSSWSATNLPFHLSTLPYPPLPTLPQSHPLDTPSPSRQALATWRLSNFYWNRSQNQTLRQRQTKAWLPCTLPQAKGNVQ